MNILFFVLHLSHRVVFLRCRIVTNQQDADCINRIMIDSKGRGCPSSSQLVVNCCCLFPGLFHHHLFMRLFTATSVKNWVFTSIRETLSMKTSVTISSKFYCDMNCQTTCLLFGACNKLFQRIGLLVMSLQGYQLLVNRYIWGKFKANLQKAILNIQLYFDSALSFCEFGNEKSKLYNS